MATISSLYGGKVVGLPRQSVGGGGFSSPNFSQELGLLELVSASNTGFVGGGAVGTTTVNFRELTFSSLLRELSFWVTFIGDPYARRTSLAPIYRDDLSSWNFSVSKTMPGRRSIANVLMLEDDDRTEYTGSCVASKPTSGTVAFWVNVIESDSLGTAQTSTVVGVGALADDDYVFVGLMPGGYPFVKVKTVTEDVWVSFGGGGSNLLQRGWCHVAVTTDGSEYKCYVNGAQLTATVETGTNNGLWVNALASDNPILSIGSKDNPPGYKYGLSEVALWDRPVTERELRNLWLYPNSPYKSSRRFVVADRNRLGPPSIASAEAFGTHRLNQQIRLTSIASAEAFGTPTLVAPQLIQATAIPSAEAFGTHRLNGQVRATGIPTAEAFGSHRLNRQVRATGTPTAEAFGTPRLNQQVRLVGVASAEAFGTAVVTVGAAGQTIVLVGVPTAEAFGTHRLVQQVRLVGVASAEAFGTTRLNQQLRLVGISSAEAFGTHVLRGQVRLTGIPTAEAFGTPALRSAIFLQSIPTAEAFGTARLNQQIRLISVSSAEAFGTPVVSLVAGGQTLVLVGVPSAEAFGTHRLNRQVRLPGIDSAEAFGLARINQQLRLVGVPSAEALGTPVLRGSVVLTGVPTAEAFGTPVLVASGLVSFLGIPSAEMFGLLRAHQQIRASGVPSAEAFGLALVGNVRISAAISDFLGERRTLYLFGGERRVLITGTGERKTIVDFLGDKT